MADNLTSSILADVIGNVSNYPVNYGILVDFMNAKMAAAPREYTSGSGKMCVPTKNNNCKL